MKNIILIVLILVGLVAVVITSRDAKESDPQSFEVVEGDVFEYGWLANLPNISMDSFTPPETTQVRSLTGAVDDIVGGVVEDLDELVNEGDTGTESTEEGVEKGAEEIGEVISGAIADLQTGLGVVTGSACYGPDTDTYLYHFPYKAKDFLSDTKILRGKPIHSGYESDWQLWAYDLGAAVADPEGVWRDLGIGQMAYFDERPPDPENYFAANIYFHIYGKPVYAMSEGVIINCWRNAPENPRGFWWPVDRALVEKYGGDVPLSEQAWLSDEMRRGEMYGSGNFLIIREDDGDHVHYAHAKPGTISVELCPHEGELLSPATWKADSAVPLAEQVRVRVDQFLFETGNSGSSSAPHLHIERTRPDGVTSLRIRFLEGAAVNLHHGKQEGMWYSFAGKQIPPGPVIVGPAQPGF